MVTWKEPRGRWHVAVGDQGGIRVKAADVGGECVEVILIELRAGFAVGVGDAKDVRAEEAGSVDALGGDIVVVAGAVMAGEEFLHEDGVSELEVLFGGAAGHGVVIGDEGGESVGGAVFELGLMELFVGRVVVFFGEVGAKVTGKAGAGEVGGGVLGLAAGDGLGGGVCGGIAQGGGLPPGLFGPTSAW